MMEMEHETAGGILRDIRSLTRDYTLPEGACDSYTLLYLMLEEFEEDLLTHVHLENHILSPAAIKMERTLEES